METGSLEAVEVVAQHGVTRPMGNDGHGSCERRSVEDVEGITNGNFIGDKSAGHERH